MWQDLRFAFRTLAKNPGFTIVAVTALALGIGANATVFSLVNAIMFKNLPFADSEGVLYISSENPKNPRGNNRISVPDFRDLRGQLKSFEALAASSNFRANFSDNSSFPESFSGARITAN